MRYYLLKKSVVVVVGVVVVVLVMVVVSARPGKVWPLTVARAVTPGYRMDSRNGLRK